MKTTAQPNPPSKQYWLDRQWIHDHYADLVEDHANKWIAVHRAQLLAAHADLGVVEDAARAGCSAEDIVFQFIDDGSLIF
jgi:hypothetical protein